MKPSLGGRYIIVLVEETAAAAVSKSRLAFCPKGRFRISIRISAFHNFYISLHFATFHLKKTGMVTFYGTYEK